MSRLTASNLIRFSPEAGGGSGGSGAASRFELSLATRLDGVTQWATTAGEGLQVRLTIAFAPQSMCARAALTGINPPGHAPLVVESARYNDSDCWYDGPDGEPLLIYHDAPSDAPDWDKKLLIHFPNKNLFSLFEWPAPVVMFDPPLREGRDGADHHA
ncbi:MAG: hypothetical protein MZV65_43725 [Chromatiales bacterium]|nr:hypothetical protein [Chromatiales bacterium]